MSYLSSPRLSFRGSFQADVSTINNDPEHFDDARFLARYQERGQGQSNGWWNPSGSGAWRLRDCHVTQVVYGDGTSGGDPVVGLPLVGADDRVSAKLVDLDPEQQMVSTIYGLRVTVRSGDGTPLFSGEFEPIGFTDIWTRYPQGHPDSFFGASYQSVLTGVEWGDVSGSAFAQELKAASVDGLLSVKLNVDGYDDDHTSPTFTWGRVVGTIGAYLPGEPHHFLAERVLQGQGGPLNLNTAPFLLDRAANRLVLDLGNSLPTTRPGGPLAASGPLRVALLVPDGPPVVVAVVDPTSAGLYDTDAGIVSVHLDPALARTAATCPVGVLGADGTVALAERPDGRFVRSDAFVFRLYPVAPDDTVTTTLYATAFGERAAGVSIGVTQADSSVPQSAVSVPATVTTGPDGTAPLTITGTSPGNPRGYIDGQVYTVAYGWDGDQGTANGNSISLLVFDEYVAPERPTWFDDVLPILQQYANLYPVMRPIVDLSSYHSVVRRAGMLELAMSLPVSDPNYMPVTRDLSPGKRSMLLSWLVSDDHPMFRLDDVASLRRVVQAAIEIEHATIPAYLYALFSIKPGRNPEVATILADVVVQEMLHMALACNLLNALGGEPVIDKPGFVPSYPGHLPGSVRPDLVVSLRRCSIEQVRDVFLAIEMPEETYVTASGEPVGVDTRGVTVAASGTPSGPVAEAAASVAAYYTGLELTPYTIGWFYTQVAKAVVELSKTGNIFTGDPARQLTPAAWPDAPGRLYAVTDVDTALLAIHEIVRQGEGASAKDPLGGDHELAHYFRFRQIVEGRQMVQDASGEWSFSGPPVTFDPDGVYAVVDDPQLTDVSGAAVEQSALFDQTYAGVLRTLHAVFNGEPTERRLGTAVGSMFSLKVIAQRLAQMPVSDGSPFTAGPLFQVG